MNDEYVVRSENLKAYADEASSLNDQFQYFKLIKISRGENEEVDKLEKITFGETPNDEGVEVKLPLERNLVQPLQQVEQVGLSWIDEIKDYISSDVLLNVKQKQDIFEVGRRDT